MQASLPRITPPLVFVMMTLASVIMMPINAHAAKISPCPDQKSTSLSPVDEYNIAHAYDKGACGLIIDQKSALQWYTRAAEQGDMLAQYELGEIYFTGKGVTPDFPAAKKWFLAAATQGHGLSQLRLAYLYAEAHFKGVTTDFKEAERWFLAAAEQDAGDARFRLGNFYHNYKTPSELDKAVHWLTLAAEGGNRTAMFDLARMMQKGEGTKQDPEQALVWLKRAADLDMRPAQQTLSEMYAMGSGGVAKDSAQSLMWTLRVVNEPSAGPYWLNRAADMLFEGADNVPKNYLQALHLYERAALKGDAHATTRLGLIYKDGLGTSADPAKAREYLAKAAQMGDPEAKGLLK